LLDLWRYNKRLFGGILFGAASEALQALLADPKYCGGRVGLLAALHTWSQTLANHVHLHVLVTAGGLDEESGRWRRTRRECLLPRQVLMIVFRGKFRAAVLDALASGELIVPPGKPLGHWQKELNRLGRRPWNVKVFGRYRDGRSVACYLARYLRGGPIGNSRLLGVDQQQVRFRSRVPAQEGADRSRQSVTHLSIGAFILRLLEHVPVRGMQTVRGYGLYSGNQYSRLSEAFVALGRSPASPPHARLELATWLERLGIDPCCLNCSVCGLSLETIYVSGRRRSVSRGPPATAGSVALWCRVKPA
jgi:hypothetical protein